MEDSKLVGTPMCTGLKLTKGDYSKEVDQTLYRSIIGKLQYVVHTRLDIALAVGIVAIFSTKPREIHMMAVKSILRYLKRTKDYGLWYKLGGNLDCTFQSIAKAEYVAVAVNCSNIVWFK